MHDPPAAAERAYFPELDGLRFLAFFLVFGFHGGLPWLADVISWATLPLFVLALPFGAAASEWVADLGPGTDRALRQNGWVGVQLFFVLSGFVITTMLLREEARYGRVDLRAFWVRRVLRIWPLYYLTVALTFFIMPAVDGRMSEPGHVGMLRAHLPWFLAFLGNWSLIRSGPVGQDEISILWSVCVEEQFYVLCPLLIVFVPRRWRLPVVSTLMAGSVAVRAWLARGGPQQAIIQYNTAAQLDTILSGVALAMILGGGPGVRLDGRVGRAWTWAVLAGSIWVLTRSELGHRTVGRQTWDFVAVWAVGVGIVALPVLHDGRARRWLATGRLVWLGRITYGLYMIHEVGFWAARKLLPRTPSRSVPGSVLALALTVALAAASYYGFERPFLRLKLAWTRVPSRPT